MSDLCLVKFLLYVFDLIMGRLEGGTYNFIPTSNSETLGKTSEIHLQSLKKERHVRIHVRKTLKDISERNLVKRLKFKY